MSCVTDANEPSVTVGSKSLISLQPRRLQPRRPLKSRAQPVAALMTVHTLSLKEGF